MSKSEAKATVSRLSIAHQSPAELSAMRAAASAMLAALEADDDAFANLIAYLTKHRDRLPPFTTASIEVRREKLAATIVAARAAGINPKE